MNNSFNRIIKKVYLGLYSVAPVPIKRGMNRIVRFGLNHRKMSFEIHLVEHCNLNCKGCDNYSPVAPKEFVDIVTFTNEMKQMKHIFGSDGIDEIRLLGGEPLLHPQINELLIISRNIFPSSKLTLITNGILLPRLGKEFFKICSESRIQVLVTKYPIKFDYDKILAVMRKYGVECGAFNTEPVKTLFKRPLDPNGLQDKKKMFDLCTNANHCISLKDGRLYTCSNIPNVHHLNSYFNCSFQVSENDSINIFQITNKKKIRKFLSEPVPFCRYCNIEHETFGIKWETSKKKLSEWI